MNLVEKKPVILNQPMKQKETIKNQLNEIQEKEELTKNNKNNFATSKSIQKIINSNNRNQINKTPTEEPHPVEKLQIIPSGSNFE